MICNTPPTPDKTVTNNSMKNAIGKKAKIDKLIKNNFIICSNSKLKV